jgi:hypothetical protein
MCGQEIYGICGRQGRAAGIHCIVHEKIGGCDKRIQKEHVEHKIEPKLSEKAEICYQPPHLNKSLHVTFESIAKNPGQVVSPRIGGK